MEPYLDVNGTRLSPSLPTNCPWFTAGEFPAPFIILHNIDMNQVNTTFLKNEDLSHGEVAVSLLDAINSKLNYYSRGGFSNVFGCPSY